MKSFAHAIVLALALGSASAGPSVGLSVKSSVSKPSPSGEATVEQKVSDNLSVGVNLSSNESYLKSVFGKFTQKAGNGDVGVDLSVNVDSKQVSGDVSYAEGDNELKANVNTGSEGVVNSVKYTKSGKGWKFGPTFHIKEKNMDLEASADYSADTNVAVKVAASGEGKVKVKHTLDADTSFTFSGTGTDVNALAVEASRKVGESDTVKPKFEVGSKHLSVGWKHALDAGRAVTLNVNPQKSVGVEFEGSDDEDWKAGVSAPWGEFSDADVSVGKKFSF